MKKLGEHLRLVLWMDDDGEYTLSVDACVICADGELLAYVAAFSEID
jgi:hypothetical protein